MEEVVKIMEECEVIPATQPQPPMASVIPLTFLDIPWLFFPPFLPLFLFDYPHPLPGHFHSTTLPALKRSLSLALLPFSPFAGRLSFSPSPSILLSSHDHVILTVAESSADVRHLSGHHPRDMRDFRLLVPTLPTPASNRPPPLLAVQVTLFPRSAGLSVGLSYHHAVGDGRTFNHFLNAWSSFCKGLLSGLSSPPLALPWPFHDRTTVISDPGKLELTFLREFWQWQRENDGEWPIGLVLSPNESEMAKATFVVSPGDMANTKQWIVARCDSKGLPCPVHLSPYVLACAVLWVAWAGTHFQHGRDGKAHQDRPVYFGFVAGGMTRIDNPVPVPPTYLGNFVGFGRAEATCKELLGGGRDGIIAAAREIGATIKKLDREILGQAGTWISDWKVFWESEIHVIVVGSPKVSLYDIDFGWGRPIKIEDVSIDRSRRRAMSLTESRHVEGGIEVGVALPRDKLHTFTSLFSRALHSYM